MSEPEQTWDVWGRFVYGDLLFAAYLPDSAPMRWKLTATREGELLAEQLIDMAYQPRFGPDPVDVSTLNRAADALLVQLTAVEEVPPGESA